MRGRKKAKPSVGEQTDRRQLSARLAKLGVRSEDPFLGGFITEVYMMLTLGCNLRCRACSLWGVGGACHDTAYYKAASRPAPLKRLLRFIDEVSRYRPQNINISGGEPLLSPHWRILADHARKRGLSTILTTNGVLLDRYADRVAESFDQVSISVASPPALREKLRMGPPGHYEAMVRGLRRLAGLRDRSPDRKPVLRLLCEVFDSNSAHLGELVEYLKGEGVVFDEILFQHLIFNKPEDLAAQEKVLREEFGLPFGLWKGYGYSPQPMDFAAFDRALKGLRKRYGHARFSIDLRGPKALRDYYTGRRRRKLSAPFCDSPWRQVNVMPNGDVWVCPDFILGNIQKSRFPEIWDGPMARALRRRVSRRLFPSCRGCFAFYVKDAPLGREVECGRR